MTTYQEIASQSAQRLPDSKYTVADISDESERIVTMADGLRLRILNPVALIIRKGGSTHRVVTEAGEVFCYAAPETGKSYIQWVPKGDKVLF